MDPSWGNHAPPAAAGRALVEPILFREPEESRVGLPPASGRTSWYSPWLFGVIWKGRSGRVEEVLADFEPGGPA